MLIRPKALVLGGGVAGASAAINLSQRDVDVTLVERDAVLGGNARTVCCKAVDGECQFCGGCLLADTMRDLDSVERLHTLTRTSVVRARRADGGFYVETAPGNGEAFYDAVILATGFAPIDARTRGSYGYGVLPMVTTGEEMERRLRQEGQHAYDDLPLERVAFIQCVGSRDEHAGRGYCSQVCCRYAVRLARLLKAQRPDSEITLFKMDIQVAGRDFAPARAEGIRMVAGLPAVIRRAEDDPTRAEFLYDDILESAPRRETFDLVVLSVGMRPRDDAAAVAGMFGLHRNIDGFYATTDDGVSTLVPGLFVAGACGAPRAIAESIVHAQQAAETCHRYLLGRAP
ncbi:MAG: FAD-dependent oxidoreductase [Anaerolineae bacterium]|jgi:heterodisulfide reductase subunit A